MKKKPCILLSIICLFLPMVLLLMNITKSSKNINVKVYNKTDSLISGLKLNYEGNEKELNIPSLNPNQNIKLNIIPEEEFCESCVEMKYIDKNDFENKITLLEYFEKNTDGKLNPEVDIEVFINNVDDQGKLSVDIKS